MEVKDYVVVRWLMANADGEIFDGPHEWEGEMFNGLHEPHGGNSSDWAVSIDILLLFF